MLTKVVLILDKRKELSTKYKKLMEATGIKVFAKSNPAGSIEILKKYEPDMILISDSIDENVAETCTEMRALCYNFRPVILVLSKSSHISDMVNALNAGADDFLSEPLESDIFLAKINAHFRRHFENNINKTTHLYDSKISFQYLRRLLLQNDSKFHVMLIDIKNFDFYREIYGEIAADKMLQTYQAIITSVTDNEDYLGHLGNDDFILITQRPDIEKLASYCIYAFDRIAEKFYTINEKNNGYMLLKGDDIAEKPIALVSTSIGIISNEFRKYDSVKQLISTLINTHKIAKSSKKSHYILDRQKLTSSNQIAPFQLNNNIFIVEPDDALSYLIGTAADMYGYIPLIFNFENDIFEVISDFNPAVIIIDTGNKDYWSGIDVCKKLKSTPAFSKIKIVATSDKHNKIKILNSGADVYLPKPYEIMTLFGWIKQMTTEFNE